MVWRRVLLPATFTLRELHGVIQVAMGWEGIHLYDFHLRAERYGLVGTGRIVAGDHAGGNSPPVSMLGLGLWRAVPRQRTDLVMPWPNPR
jgi:Plasmid pRiA4b ORF-3-like protein